VHAKHLFFLCDLAHNAGMASDTVQQIKDKLSIVDVVSGYVKLDRAGTVLRARCPFHAERTPSFIVSPERGTYHCFGCGVGGDMFSFIEQIEGVDFKGALKMLADKAGVEVVYSSGERDHTDERDRLYEALETATLFYMKQMDDAARTYVHGRGIDDTTIKQFRLGFAGNEWSALADHLRAKKFSEKEILDAGLAKKNERAGLTDKFRNRIMFPIRDSAGRVVAFSGRSFGPHASPEAPKYLNSPETALFHKSKILYGYDMAKTEMRKLTCAILVEGQMDLLASHQAGWGNTVAVSGTAFTVEHAQLIKRMTDNLLLALDSDPAGIKAAARAAREALRSGLNVKVVRLPQGLDPADYLLKEGSEAWRSAIREAVDIITYLLDVLEEGSKGADSFRRVVEAAILPFLHDVQSPIARAQYVSEIAARLTVPERAVEEALSTVPRVTGDAHAPEPALSHEREVGTPGRVEQAFALLLWQESLTRAHIEVDRLESDLRSILGEGALGALRTRESSELERLRFWGEHLFGNTTKVVDEARLLLKRLEEETLTKRLSDVSMELKKAEQKSADAEIERLTDEMHLLTTRIAQLRSVV